MRFTLSAAVLIAAFALPALASDDGYITEIPPGQTLYASAGCLTDLRENTAPTLAFRVPNFDQDGTEPLFVWTAKAADGNRRFTLATVYPLVSPGGNVSHVIFNPGKAYSYIQPRITAALDAKRHPNDPALSPAKQTQSLSACIASVHPKFGTLYQLSLDRPRLDVLKHDERRIFVLHDPDHGWRYVGQLPANRATFANSVDYSERRSVTTSVAWTGVPDAPVRITCQLSASYQFDQPAITVAGRYTLAGTLPAKPRDPRFTLTVQKGQTFTGIAQAIAEWRSANSAAASIAALNVRRSLTALNPALNPTRLRIGDTLIVPDVYAPLPTPKPVASAK